MQNKEYKNKEAIERNSFWASLTPQQQLESLDTRLGKGVGAKKQRAKTQIDGKSPKQWMDWMFDHTVIVAKDDPYINNFRNLHASGIIQLREVKATGAEKFAEFIFHKLNNFVKDETSDRVRVAQVEFMEHNKNTAIYRG